MNIRITLSSLTILTVTLFFVFKAGEQTPEGGLLQQSQNAIDHQDKNVTAKSQEEVSESTNLKNQQVNSESTDFSSAEKVLEASRDLEIKTHGESTITHEINHPANEPDKELLSKIEIDMRESAKDDNWATFETLADEIEDYNPEHRYNFALYIALINNAPLEVIRNIVLKGGRFNYRHLFVIANRNHYENYHEYTSMGLNVHMTSPDGRNALHAAMHKFSKNFVFNYLLVDGVDPNVKLNEYTLIQRCLIHILKTKIENDEDYVDEKYWNAASNFNRLIRHNATLTPKDWLWIEIIRKKRPRTFEVMTMRLPNKDDFMTKLDNLQY